MTIRLGISCMHNLMSLPPPLPSSGTVAHPVAVGVCLMAALFVFFSFVRGYRAANGTGPPPGEKPVWHAGLTMRLLLTAALWALGLWMASQRA